MAYMTEAGGCPPSSNCSYIHNVNPNADSDAQICRDFQRNRCGRVDCRYTHDVNPNSKEGNPRCRRFERAHKRGGEMLDQQPRGNDFGMERGPPLDDMHDFGCGRSGCTYIHNVNEKCTDETQICRDFAKAQKYQGSQGCDRIDCKYMHNVNVRASEEKPLCRNFAKVLRERTRQRQEAVRYGRNMDTYNEPPRYGGYDGYDYPQRGPPGGGYGGPTGSGAQGGPGSRNGPPGGPPNGPPNGPGPQRQSGPPNGRMPPNGSRGGPPSGPPRGPPQSDYDMPPRGRAQYGYDSGSYRERSPPPALRGGAGGRYGGYDRYDARPRSAPAKKYNQMIPAAFR